MATDNSELTFVRCPSCRSLIPAVSTRCRMCGASLDLSKEESAETSHKTSGRLRQRTMSTSEDGEMSDVRNQVRDEINFEENDAPVEPIDENDPLSAYIEEVELDMSNDTPLEEQDSVEQESEKQNITPENDEVVQESLETDDEDDWLKNLDEVVVDNPEEDVEDEGSFDFDDEFEDDLDDELPLGDLPEEDDINLLEEPEIEEELNTNDEVAIDDESELEEDIFPEVDEHVEEDITPEIGHESDEVSHYQEPNVVASQPVLKKGMPQGAHAQLRKGKQSEKHEHRQPVQEEHRTSMVHKSQKSVQVKQTPPRKGRLFGWLVSYNNPNGEGIELREGKFFVTKNPLKDHDLLLNDESVSTPHAMVMVSAEDGLKIHDLMSERGVFVRHRGEDTYQREEELSVLGNGDWVRFGDIEFLVTLIPYVGIK